MQPLYSSGSRRVTLAEPEVKSTRDGTSRAVRAEECRQYGSSVSIRCRELGDGKTLGANTRLATQ